MSAFIPFIAGNAVSLFFKPQTKNKYKTTEFNTYNEYYIRS